MNILKKYTKAKLAKILADHAKWVNNSKKGCRANLSFADLSGMDLSGKDLWRVILDYSNLQSANLSHTDLTGANLSHADLTGANLSYSTLIAANLEEVSASCADFSHSLMTAANLSHGSFSQANMSDTTLEQANLGNYAQFMQTNLKHANLHHAIGSNVRFCIADLRGADLRWATLPGSVFSNATLTGIKLDHATLNGSNFNFCAVRKVSAIGADLRNCSFCKAKIFSIDLRDASLLGASLESASITGPVNYDWHTDGYIMVPPAEGEYIAWKQASGFLVKLLIPADAKRSSATTRKCRASKAMVLGIHNMDGSLTKRKSVKSNYDSCFVYTVGETVQVADFDDNRWEECGPGIHHFLAKDEAVRYCF